MKHIRMIMMSFFIIFLSGCSTKNEMQKEVSVQEQKIDESSEDLLLEEFDDEFRVEKKSDPLSGYNRIMTNFNDGAYEYVFLPVSNGYKYVVHEEIRSSIGKFFHNILYPVRLVNNLLQGKVQNSVEETGRFVINTTLGVLGLFDPAKSYFELDAHEEDFGQTLGYWGVGAGPHIVLPFLGPSNLRDTISIYPNSLINPIDYQDNRSYNLAKDSTQSLYIKGFQSINHLSLNSEKYEKLRADAVDLYPYMRDVYEQLREKQIKE